MWPSWGHNPQIENHWTRDRVWTFTSDCFPSEVGVPRLKGKVWSADPWFCLLGHTKALRIATLPRSRLLQCSYWVMGSVASPTPVQTKASLLVHFFSSFLKSFPRTDGIPWLQGKVPSDGACLFNEKNLIIWFCLPLVLYFSFYPPPSFPELCRVGNGSVARPKHSWVFNSQAVLQACLVYVANLSAPCPWWGGGNVGESEGWKGGGQWRGLVTKTKSPTCSDCLLCSGHCPFLFGPFLWTVFCVPRLLCFLAGLWKLACYEVLRLLGM